MTKQETAKQEQEQLPVLIAGAGPCGLVAAATFQKRGVPFVILERASRSTICSNAGSGFELAPTAVHILKEELGVDTNQIMSTYGGMAIMTVEGKTIRREEFPYSYQGGSVNRAEMQQYLLDMIFPSAKDEEGILLCGSGLDSYTELVDTETNTKTVVAKLTSGKEIKGCVLLACDGIHSRCRAVMHGGDSTTNKKSKDPLRFCNAVCYWGKTLAPKGSALQTEFLKNQAKITTEASGNSQQVQKTSMVMGMATKKVPAVFFIVPSKENTVLLWGITVSSKTTTGDSKTGDLTRRGGRVLTEADKERLLSFGSHNKNSNNSESLLNGIQDFPLLEMILDQTPAKDITQAGFFDRKNLNLPYTSKNKLVALLGDAAHPQTPFLGQGVNMAITDAYVYANILSDSIVSQKYTLTRAMELCDTNARRKNNKKAVKLARLICDFSNSSNRFVCWVMGLLYKHLPSEEFMNQINNTDWSNHAYWEYFQSLNNNSQTKTTATVK